MKLWSLFAILMLFSVSSHADMVARDAAGNVVKLHTQKCAVTWLKDWKAATFVYEGKTYDACWREQAGMILVLDAAGDVTPLPPYAFKSETEV